MTKSDQDPPAAEGIDIRALGRAVWRAKAWILGLAVGAGALTFIVLSLLRPLYTSEARILIQDDASTAMQRGLDAQAVQSEVQAIASRDLAVEVIKALDLTGNPAFAADAGTSAVERWWRGLGGGADRSEEDKAVDTFAEHLAVFPLATSSVIAIDYTSGDSGLAAQVANKLADVYIAWQRQAALEQTKDATAWLNAQIEVLRPKLAEAEAAVQQFKASGSSGAEIKLRALEDEAKAERELLNSYLGPLSRCERAPRHGRGAGAGGHRQPRACLAMLPSFPQRGPISLLAAGATVLLSLAYLLPRALTGSPAVPGQPIAASDPRLRERRAAAPPRQAAPPEPAAATTAAAPAIWRPAAADDVDRLRGTSTRIFAPASLQAEFEAAASLVLAHAPAKRCAAIPHHHQAGRRARGSAAAGLCRRCPAKRAVRRWPHQPPAPQSRRRGCAGNARTGLSTGVDRAPLRSETGLRRKRRTSQYCRHTHPR